MPRKPKKAPRGSDDGAVDVRLVLDLAPGTLTLRGRVANLDVRRGARGLDLRARLGRIALRDLVAEFRAREPGRTDRT